MLSGPIGSQPSSLRLVLAIVLAFAVLNAAGVLLPKLLVRRWFTLKSTVSFLPR